jgi:hypothetical protein
MKMTTDYYRNFAKLREIKYGDYDAEIEEEFILPSHFKPGDVVEIWFDEKGEARYRVRFSLG